MFRELLKNALAQLLHGSGLLGLLVRRRFRDRALVLTYHRVLPRSARQASFSHDAIIVAPEVFEQHLATLKRYFSCLDINEFFSRLQRHDFSGPAQCLITFDDAWRDNHTYALDILKRCNTPAVIFVPTDYIGSGDLFWQEKMGHFVNQICLRFPETAMEILGRYGWGHIPALADEQRIDEIKSAVRMIKTKEYPEIDHILEELENTLDGSVTDYGPDTYLSVAQMREMMSHGVSFQSHGCSHRVFPRLPPQKLHDELVGSARWLNEQLGSQPMAIAYPNGDHSTAVQQQTADAGYGLAFTTIGGYVDQTSDAYKLKRINLNDNAAGNEARLLLTLLMSS